VLPLGGSRYIVQPFPNAAWVANAPSSSNSDGEQPIMINNVVRWTSLVLVGVFAGFLVAVLVLEYSLRSFDASVYVQVRQVELVGLDVLATATLLPALAATAYLVAVERRPGVIWRLTPAALVLLALIFGTSLLINVPINAEQVSWNPGAPPTDWATVRDRWQLAHLARTVAGLLAFGCLSAAALRQTGGRAASSMRSRPGRRPASSLPPLRHTTN
jgi:anthrone oxygenase-like protein